SPISTDSAECAGFSKSLEGDSAKRNTTPVPALLWTGIASNSCMFSLLRECSRSSQPPPGTVFPLPRPFLAALCRRYRPFSTGAALAGGALGPLGRSSLTPTRFGHLAPERARGGQMQVDGRGDLVDRRHAIHALEHAFAGVIAGQRGRLGAIGRKPPLQNVRIVVGSGLLPARGHFSNPLFDSPKENALVDLEFNHPIQPETTLSQQAIKRLGLRNRARKPVKHEAALSVRPVDPFGNDSNHHVIGNQFAAVHDAHCAQTRQ